MTDAIESAEKRESYRQAMGQLGEELAAVYLRAHGYEILARNYRCREGEIDIIAAQPDTLAFIEVKTRSAAASSQPIEFAFGQPIEAVDSGKRRRIRLAAARYLAEREAARELEDAEIFYYENIEFQVVEVVLSHHAGLIF